MDSFEFLPENYQMIVFRLMEALHIGMSQALNLLTATGFNYDVPIRQTQLALQRKLPNVNPETQNTLVSMVAQPIKIKNPAANTRSSKSSRENKVKKPHIYIDVDEGLQFTQNNLMRQVRQSYNKTYIIKKRNKLKPKSQRIKGKGKTSADKIEEQLTFQQNLRQFLGGQVCVSFKNEISEGFIEMWSNPSKMIAIHCLKLPVKQHLLKGETEEDLNYIQEVYKAPQLAETLNKWFINVGLNPTDFDFPNHEYMKEYLNIENDDFVIILLKLYEKTRKVQMVRKIKIREDIILSNPKLFITQIQRIREEIYRKENSQVKPMNQATNKKIQEDRIIRQQQQQQYYEAAQFMINKSNEIRDSVKQEEKRNSKKNSVLTDRKRLRESLIRYGESFENGIDFKIRFPNGDQVKLRLPLSETAQYLFDFIKSYQKEELGFQEELQRNFQIIQPFDKLELSDKKHLQFYEIFANSDMETLMIKELLFE